ncbi:MAG: dynamin family protein [Bacillota bacterium]|nr:dynamin family protein [Bacillota bacterium]
MSIDYKSLEFELYGVLLQIRDLLEDTAAQEEERDEIDRRLEQIKSKRYNVAVVGEFRRGKSSLINALLGLPVLPADVTPTTATVNRITYGTEPRATILYRDGHTETLDEIGELVKYVTKISTEHEKMAEKVKEAIVYYPAVLCQNHVDIIDTPGLDDDETMTAITLNMLDNIDAAIVTVSALSPFSETERHFVSKLIAHRGISTVCFVVTFIDQIDEDEYDRVFAGIRRRIQSMTMKTVKEEHGSDEWLMAKAHRILDEMAIYGVSARKALDAFAANDNERLKESRFVYFKEELFKLLTSWQMVHMFEKGAQTARDVLVRMSENVEKEEQALEREREQLTARKEQIEGYRQAAAGFTDRQLQQIAYQVSGLITPKIGREQVLVELQAAQGLAALAGNITAELRQTMGAVVALYQSLDEPFRKRATELISALGAPELEGAAADWIQDLMAALAQKREAAAKEALAVGERLIQRQSAELGRRDSVFAMRMGISNLVLGMWRFYQEAARRMRLSVIEAAGSKSDHVLAAWLVDALDKDMRQTEEQAAAAAEKRSKEQAERKKLLAQCDSILRRIAEEHSEVQQAQPLV